MFFVINVTRKRKWSMANLSFFTNQRRRNVPTVTAQESVQGSQHFQIKSFRNIALQRRAIRSRKKMRQELHFPVES